MYLPSGLLKGGDTLTVTAPKVTLAFFFGMAIIGESAVFLSGEAVEFETFEDWPAGTIVTFELLVTDVGDKIFEAESASDFGFPKSAGITTQWR